MGCPSSGAAHSRAHPVPPRPPPHTHTQVVDLCGRVMNIGRPKGYVEPGPNDPQLGPFKETAQGVVSAAGAAGNGAAAAGGAAAAPKEVGAGSVSML